MSTSSDEQRLVQIIFEAAGLDGTERERYLQEIATEDPELSAEARRRLEAVDDISTAFLETPAVQRLGPEDAPEKLPSAAALPVADRYEIGELLGQGGMGQVFSAIDHQLGRTVAIKLLTHEDPWVLRLFLNEARAQARVEHKNVLEVYDSGELEGRPFIAMRYAAEGTLADLDPGFSLEEKVRLLAQAARGLDAAHRKGLLHRDIKPSNILLESGDDGELQALVTDFGLAQELADGGAEANEDLVGSPQYMAPERLTHPGDAPDRRSDIYSLGITLYRTLAGALPWQGEATLAVLQRTLREDLPAPRSLHPALPKELEAIILRCTARDPAERYATARSVAEDLERYLAGEVVEAYAAGLAYRLVRFGLRNRTVVGLAAGALVLLIASSITVSALAWRLSAALDRAEIRHVQAEELIHFMLFDLREKLESLGRLDVLTAADAAAVEYFAAVPASELSETELLRRSRMLYQIGDVRIRQGDLQGAAAPMTESLELVERLLTLRPDDSERLFELGQAHFWVGFVAWEQGDLPGARGPMESYLQISQQLVEKDPTNLDWRRELSYAHSNLGSLLQAEGEPEKALGEFLTTLAIDEELVAAVPTPEARSAQAATHNTIGVALQDLNRLSEAEDHLRSELEIHHELLALDPEAPGARANLGNGLSYLGKLLLDRGKTDAAESSFFDMRDIFADLTAHDPENSDWSLSLVWSQIQIGQIACIEGNLDAAETAWGVARSRVDEQLARDATLHDWRRTQAVVLYYLSILQESRANDAASTVRRAIELLEALSTERPTDRRVQRWLSWSSRLLTMMGAPSSPTEIAGRAAEFCRAEDSSSFMSSRDDTSR